jgi:Carboxypeptidase regulatory-like domain
LRQLQGFLGDIGRLCLAAALVVAAFTVQKPALAQVADGVVEIEVVDDTGVALPGVSVELKRPETGFSRAAVSRSTGLTHFAPVVPGEYRAKISLSGFETVERALAVRVGQTAPLRVVIRPKAIQEAVTVMAQVPLVDVYKIDSSTNIVPEQIKVR